MQLTKMPAADTKNALQKIKNTHWQGKVEPPPHPLQFCEIINCFTWQGKASIGRQLQFGETHVIKAQVKLLFVTVPFHHEEAKKCSICPPSFTNSVLFHNALEL